MRKVSFLTLYMTDSVGNVFILFLRLQYRILGWKGLSIRVFAPLSSSCSMAIRGSTSIPIPVPFSVTGLGSCLHPDGGETSQALILGSGSVHYSVTPVIWQLRDFCLTRFSLIISLVISSPPCFSLRCLWHSSYSGVWPPGLFL